MPKSTDLTSAVSKLELSRVDRKAIQLGGMGEDIDVEHFSLLLSSKIKTDLVGRIVDGSLNRTIEGASTLKVVLSDDDGTILNSGLLTNKLDVQLDGVWFRFASLDDNDSELTMTFEDREIAILREYATWKIARRSKTTRAEFVLNLIREVKEFKIPFVIPELHVIQPIERYNGDILGTSGSVTKSTGITQDANTFIPGVTDFPQSKGQATLLTVKGATADQTQLRNAEIILNSASNTIGPNNKSKRKILVCVVMTAITESTMRNNPGGDNAHGGGEWDSAGLFQQTGDWGTYAERTDPASAARAFTKAAIAEDAANPNEPYWALCANVQHPREDLRQEYNKWRTEAERFVNAFGEVSDVNAANAMDANIPGGSTGSNYAFWRGKIEDRHGNKIRKPENSWSCIQRLADDVDWRAFFVTGTFYFMSEEDLFKQKPIATISKYTEGIQKWSGNYDRNKKSGSITFSASIGKWAAPPGSVIVVKQSGPLNGRWIVNEFSRGLFDDVAQITLKKPRPSLPEPLNDDSQDVNSTWYDQPQPVDTGLAGRQLYQAVLNNKSITFTRDSQKSDILSGQIDDRVLQFLLWLTAQGRPVTITALKSDHSKYTSEGRLSAHGDGRAVDLGNYGETNPNTDEVMRLIANGQVITGFDQLIGPNPLLVLPLGYYDSQTLQEHKNHIHVGWHL